MRSAKLMPASIIILAASILLGSVYLGSALEKNEKADPGSSPSPIIDRDKALITLEEAAVLLGITADDILDIINKEQEFLDEYHEFRGKMFPISKFAANYILIRKESAPG